MIWKNASCFEDGTCRDFEIRDYHKFYDGYSIKKWCFAHTYQQDVNGTWEIQRDSAIYIDWENHLYLKNNKAAGVTNCDWARDGGKQMYYREPFLDQLLNTQVWLFTALFG